MSNKVVNKSKLKYMNEFPIIIMIAVAIIVILLAMMYLSIKPYSTIYTNGYMVLSGNMTYNLINDNNKEELNVGVTPVSNGDYLYKQMNNYYVGVEKKIEVEQNYPIYSSDGLTIYNLRDDVTLIDRNFEKLKGYSGLSINYGVLYNRDEIEPADDIDYLFLDLNNSIYINTQIMVIKTLMNEYTIPINSPVYFNTNYINYYVFDGKNFAFNKIPDIYYDSIVKIGDVTLTYNEFLLQMELIKLNEILENHEEEIDKENNEQINEGQKEEFDEENNNQVEYVKPSVSTTEFSTNVYSADAELTIYDPAGVITSSPMFEIYIENDKLYSRNRFNSSGKIKLTGLSSNTKYKVVGTYKYKNKEGVSLVSTFYEGTIETKDIESLEQIKITSQLGEIYSNKIEIKDLNILNNESESVLGIKKVVIDVWKEGSTELQKFELSYLQIRKLINGEKITYSTTESLASSTPYKYIIKFYDKEDNELKASGDISGLIKTSKQEPKVEFVSNIDTKRNEITVNIKTKNPDDLYIKDYKYELYLPTGDLVYEGRLNYTDLSDNNLLFENLDYNSNYTLRVSGLYDLEDGKGTQKLLKEKTFTTVNLKENFTAWYDEKTLEVTHNSITSDIYLGTNLVALERTDTEVVVFLVDKNGNEILDESGDLKYYKKYSKEEYSNGNSSIYHVKNTFEGLESNTEYKIKIRINIKQFNDVVFVEKELNPSIKTNVEHAYVIVKSKKLIGNTLSFNLEVVDNDNLLSNGGVIIEIYKGKLNSEKEISDKKIYRELRDVKNNKYIDVNLSGYDEDNYTIFISSKPYNNSNIQKYLTINDLHSEKTAINVDREIKAKLELYEQLEVNSSKYNTKVRFQYELSETKESIFLIDCVNGNCLSIGYFNEEKEFIEQNKFNGKEEKGNKIILGILNNRNDGNHKLYAVIQNTANLKGMNSSTVIKETSLHVQNSVYILATLDYNTNQQIYNISSAQNLYDIPNNSSNHYVVTENLNLKNINNQNRSYTFNGNIDFQGYSVDLYRNNQNVFTIFNKLTAGAIIKNAVLNYNLVYDGVIEALPGFIYENSGIIENIIANVKQCYEENGLLNCNKNDQKGRAKNLGLLAFKNSGTINNFVVNLESDVHTYSDSSLVTYINNTNAIISNGYINTNNNSKIILHDTTANHGTFANVNYGTIKNIYNLVSVISAETSYTGGGIATIAKNNATKTATVKNTVSVATITQKSAKQNGPNLYSNTGTAKNNYYVDTNANNFSYSEKYSKRIDLASLMNPNVWELFINEENRFQIVSGYYPILKMNTFMENNQKLKPIEFNYIDESKLDIISSEAISDNKNDDNIAEVNVYISNPDKVEITEILIEDLTSKIDFEKVEYDERLQVSIIPLRLSVKGEDKAKSNYNIVKFKYKDDLGGEHEKLYTNTNNRKITVDMYRQVGTYDQFVESINNNENIYLMDDISPTQNDDLVNREKNEDKLPSNITYTSILDGNNKTLDLSDLSLATGTNEITRGYFIYEVVTATIKNLQVANIIIHSNNSYIGFIRASKDSLIENIDITESTITIRGNVDTMYVGSLIAYSENSIIKNVSVNHLNIQKANPYTRTIKYNYVGGIIGYASYSNISNSYIYNLNIDNMYKDVIVGSTSVGGIIGNSYITDVMNCYSTGTINTEYSEVGGIVGHYNQGSISNNYSYMKISSNGDYLGGIIGWPNPNVPIQNNMFIGNLKNDKAIANVSLIVPSSNGNVKTSNYVLIDENKYKNFTVIQDTNNLSQFDANEAFSENKNIDDLPYLKETSFVEQQIKNEKFENYVDHGFTYSIEYVSDNSVCKNPNATIYNEEIYNNVCSTQAKIIFKDSNGNTIENVNVTSIDGDLSIRKDEDNNIILSPNGRYSSYYDIEVKLTSESKEKNININAPFYRKISSQDDWDEIQNNENIILLNDIEITEAIEKNKIINNLLGNGYSIGGKANDNRVELNDSLIYNIYGVMQDITIQNINVTKNDNTGVGIIKLNEGNIFHSKFFNINIKNNMNYTGIVAINQGKIELNQNEKSKIVNVQNINIEGSSYAGALVGYNDGNYSTYKIYYVVADSINVKGENFVGGLFGYTKLSAKQIRVTDATVEGKKYVGGIIGYGTTTYSDISDSTIKAAGSEYVGGIGGSSTNADTHKNLKVNDVDIVDVSNEVAKQFIGGIYGLGNNFENCEVEKLVIGKNITKVSYDTFNGKYIGAISGSPVKATYCKVDNFKVKGSINVGGIGGYSRQSQNEANGNVVLNSEVTASTNAGGIFGKYLAPTDGQEAVKNNMVINTKIIATTNAGGIIGYLENNNTYSQNIKFYGNLALAVTVSSPVNAGGIIGDLYQVPASSTILFRNSLFYGSVSNICDTCTLIGNIQNNKTGAISGYGASEISPEDFAIKSNFKQYVSTKTKDNSYQIDSIGELDSFITNYNQESTEKNLKYPTEDKTYFPIHTSNAYPSILQNNYVAIPSSTETANVMMSYSMLRNRSFSSNYINPIDIDFDVYSSGVNKINIEFSDIDDNVYFYYKIGNYVSNPISINKRTYTLTYDYKTPINIYVTNNFNQKEKTINPNDVAKTISLVNDETYYINNNSLYSESKMLTGNFKNLYGKEALTSDGKIYNIVTKKEHDANINYEILYEETPIYEMTYKGNNVKTYYNYSVVNGEEKNIQVFIKNGNLSSIDSSLNNRKNMYIIDFYNNNEIQIILKEDGKLYSLKQNIKYPSDFKNSNIKELYTNINATNNIAVLKYENGEVYTFDYRTGNLIFNNATDTKISIFDYIKNKIDGSSKNNVIENVAGYDKYTEIEMLKNKFLNISIDEAKDKIYNSNTSLKINDDYILVYNDITQNYEVYKTSTLLKNSIELESETDKIYKNYELVKFYKTLGESKKKNSANGIILFTISIVLILMSLAILIKHKINKKGEII